MFNINISAPHYHFLSLESRSCHHANKNFCLTINLGKQSPFPSPRWVQLSFLVYVIHSQSYGDFDETGFLILQCSYPSAWLLKDCNKPNLAFDWFPFSFHEFAEVEIPIIFDFDQQNVFFFSLGTLTRHKCQRSKQWLRPMWGIPGRLAGSHQCYSS